jgi:hypothetical protein
LVGDVGEQREVEVFAEHRGHVTVARASGSNPLSIPVTSSRRSAGAAVVVDCLDLVGRGT